MPTTPNPNLSVRILCHAAADVCTATARGLAAAAGWLAQHVLTPLCGALGSAGVMERSETTKQGITFGNSMAGAGAAGEVSSIATGSAGVMERTETTKQGITFGNAASK